MIPPFEMNINNHHYYRTGAHSTIKSIALKHAEKLRKEGHLARVVKGSDGKWSTYFAANQKRVMAFKKSLPREIQHLVR